MFSAIVIRVFNDQLGEDESHTTGNGNLSTLVQVRQQMAVDTGLAWTTLTRFRHARRLREPSVVVREA
jgi:hypothetical protein